MCDKGNIKSDMSDFKRKARLLVKLKVLQGIIDNHGNNQI